MNPLRTLKVPNGASKKVNFNLEGSKWKRTEKFLSSFIPIGKKYMFPGERGLSRTKYLLEQCGKPQEKIKIIHVAGTSGKGSTATIISHVLVGQGFTVGLSLSPHLIDLRERFQINNSFVAHDEIANIVSLLVKPIEVTTNSKFGKPTYFEIMTVLTFLLFFKKKADYAVIETGLGGTYDATNVISNKNKIAVITKIGHDHMEILGKTLPEIAAQKAGIIQEKNAVFSTIQRASVQKILSERAHEKHTEVVYVKPQLDKSIQLSLLGDFQIENCALALAAVLHVSKRDGWRLDAQKSKDSLEHIQIPGRMQQMTVAGKTVILDGAHNPQKMSALMSSLNKLYPQNKLDFLVALKKGKDYRNTLKYIVPKAASVTFTAFFLNKQGIPIQAEDPAKLQHLAKKMEYNSSVVIEDPGKALQTCLKQSVHPLIITGSFYLLSEIYVILIRQSAEKNLGV